MGQSRSGGDERLAAARQTVVSTYQLQHRDDLMGGSWQNIGAAVTGSGAPIHFNHAGGATARQRLYRIAVN
jgi:hypothetical protein